VQVHMEALATRMVALAVHLWMEVKTSTEIREATMVVPREERTASLPQSR
jgi:hypothetical protein